MDLAVLTIPEKAVESAIAACGEKGVRGITIITAGYGETSDTGQSRQERLVQLAASHGIRLLGPNVSGTFNLHRGFNASSVPGQNLLATPVAAICQGGYAFYDMLSVGWERGYGVGWFMHTGNEADLTVTDFLDSFGRNDDVRAIIMYIEAVRDGRRFLEAARRAGRRKPVLVYKGGRSRDSARAARSHTGAMAGNQAIYQGLFRQTGLIMCPGMELLLPISHALVERPPMKGKRVGIITVGGSWGVSLTDALEEAGLRVPELSPNLQKKLHSLGMPERASTRNPVDFGASGLFLSLETPGELAAAVLASGEVDALVVHGLGRPGMHDQDTLDEWKFFLDIEKNTDKRHFRPGKRIRPAGADRQPLQPLAEPGRQRSDPGRIPGVQSPGGNRPTPGRHAPIRRPGLTRTLAGAGNIRKTGDLIFQNRCVIYCTPGCE